jgi:hypothetical protein
MKTQSQLMFFLILATHSSCCSTWTNESNPDISNEAGSGGCAEVRRCVFTSLSRRTGGAIYLKGFADIAVSDCSFHSCSASSQSTTYGGACDLGSIRLSFARCCGFLCVSNNYGQFLYIIGVDISGGRSASDHTISEVTALACGSETYGQATVYLESPVSASFRDVNITNCRVFFDGVALYAESGDYPYTASYFHVEGCVKMHTVFTNRRDGFPALDHANFYANTPNSLLGCILYGDDRGMALRYCVFSKNIGTLVFTRTQQFDLDFCYFSGSGPSSSSAIVGPGCVSNFSTASYAIFAINTHDCPAVTRPASASPNASKTRPASPRATASQLFNRSFSFDSSRLIALSRPYSPSLLLRESSTVYSIGAFRTLTFFTGERSHSDLLISPGFSVTLPASRITKFFSLSSFVATLPIYSGHADQTIVFISERRFKSAGFPESQPFGRTAVLTSFLHRASQSLSASFLNSVPSRSAESATAVPSGASIGSSLSLGLISAIAIAVLAVLLAVIGLAIYLYRRAASRSPTYGADMECTRALPPSDSSFPVTDSLDAHVFLSPLDTIGMGGTEIADLWQDCNPDEVLVGV